MAGDQKLRYDLVWRKLTSVGSVSEEALKMNDNWPGWRPDNNWFQVRQVVSSLADSSNFDCTKTV